MKSSRRESVEKVWLVGARGNELIHLLGAKERGKDGLRKPATGLLFFPRKDYSPRSKWLGLGNRLSGWLVGG